MRLQGGIGILAAGLLAGCATTWAGVLPDAMTPPINVPGGSAAAPAGGSSGGAVTAPTRPSPVTTPAQPAPGVTTPAPTTGGLDALEDYILKSCNDERAKAGAKPLSMNPQLRDLARSRSQDMIARNYFDHVTPDGKRVFDMLKALNFPYTTAGENIAYNTYPQDQSAQQTMKGWMASSGHRANILNTSYGKIGIGAAKRPSDAALFYTQVFTN